MADGFNTDDMLDTYLFENQQLLEKLQEIVLQYKDEECFDEDAIRKIFRTMHTIKGSSGFMMFDSITGVSHKLEDIFYVLREFHPKNVPHLQLVEYVLEVSDFITLELEKIKDGEILDGDSSGIIAKLDKFLEMIDGEKEKTESKEIPKNDVATQKFYIAPLSRTQEKESEEEPFFLIDLESSVEEIEARVRRTQEQIMAEAKQRVLAPGDFVIQQKEPGKAKNIEKADYINVDVAKMNQLMDLMEQLTNTQTMILDNPDLKVPGLVLDYFNESAAQMTKITTELRNVIMSIRMVPLTNTFQKMNRIVFDVSRKLGKDVDFVMVGENTEVDRNIVEHISAPLMHLIRNAVDHGIEMPVDRAAAGKIERAKVTLSAKIDSEYILIIVEDNGKGLDRQQIIDKAYAQGLLDYNTPQSAYTDEEVYQFITLPGFSTKEKVTEYSGRGVGMDVVVSNIASIGGSFEIESEKGKGSKMTLKIPLEKDLKILR